MGNNYIDGNWVAGSGLHMDAIAPEDMRVLDRVPLSRATEVNSAVDAARQAFPEWRATSVFERARYMTRLVELLVDAYGDEGKPSELKTLIANETGKRLPEADIEVIESSDMVRYFADHAEQLLATETVELDKVLWPTKTSQIVLEPRGVVAVIKPWNYPLEIPLWAIAPALVSGNTVVFKPSEHSSLTGLALAQLIEAVGFPKGVFNLVTGDGETGNLLVTNPGIDMVSFSGSVPTGLKIAAIAATRLVPCRLELSGNDAALVLSDADLDLAANGLVWGAICNSGQVCVGVKRILAVDEIFDDLVDRVEKVMSGLRPGTDYGPVISRSQLEAVKTFISDATSKGAKLRLGGTEGSGGHGPLFLSPALLTDVPVTADLATRECFGPVAAMFRVSDAEEAVRVANSTNYGLGASVWTGSHEEFVRLAPLLDVGMVWENDVNVALPQAPWAGRRQSGTGCDLSKWGLYEYVHPKHICSESSTETRRAWWYPYGQQDA